MPPLIAVVADVRIADGYTWHAAAQTYLDALQGVSAAMPMIVPALEGLDASALLARVDGVLATGSRSNVHPARYREAETGEHGPFDPARDALSLGLMRAAVAKGVPMLAVCRGFQEMNVAWGGTLDPALHERPGRLDHRAPDHEDQDVRFAIRQDVTVRPGTALAGIVGAGVVRVNSLHRQGVVRIGAGLAVEAEAPDGTIEALSVTDASGFALGVQWHPDYWARTDPASRAIFEAFGDAARRCAHGKTTARRRSGAA